ncbi:putative reverse transcriptase domain-containing protein [Tanacetum coccineum]
MLSSSTKSTTSKKNDPGSFILPCSIGRLNFNNALADLGASISIMPFSMFKRLGIGKLKPINMVIEMADGIKCIPKGIVKNLLIKIDKFILPVDFVILDMTEDFRMPVILGRTLLATANVKVDIFRNTISLELGNEKILYRVDGGDFYEICDNLRFIVINNPFWKIMPPRMRNRSAGRPAAESLGEGTGVWVGRGGRGRRPREEGANKGASDFSTIIAQQLQNLLPAMLAQVSNRGNVRNQNGNVVNENVQENIGNVIVNSNRVGCSYKEFLACNPKEYDGKGGAVVLTRWIEKMESVHDMSGCSIDQKVKYTAGSFVGKALTWWNSQIRTLSQEVAVSMSWNDFKFMMIQEFCPSHEMQKLESELWNHAMVGAGHAAYIDRFHELARLVPHLVTPESRMIERYMYGLAPQIRGMVAAMEPKTIQKAAQIFIALTDEAVRNGSIKKVEKRRNVGEPSKDRSGRDDNKRTRTGPCRTCFNYNRPGHLAKDCRGVPRNVNPINARNPTVRACYECGSTDHVRPACPRLNRARGVEENHLNQVAANNGGQGRGNQGN